MTYIFHIYIFSNAIFQSRTPIFSKTLLVFVYVLVWKHADTTHYFVFIIYYALRRDYYV